MASETKTLAAIEGRLIPLVQFNKYYPDPTPAALAPFGGAFWWRPTIS